MSKEILEEEKLRLEIQKLRQKWYRNLEYWKIILPTLALLLSLYFAYQKGWLDIEKRSLEVDKKTLLLDIKEFQTQKALIENQRSIAIKDLYNLRIERDTLSFNYNSTLIKLNSLLKEKDSLNSNIKALKQSTDKFILLANSAKLETKRLNDELYNAKEEALKNYEFQSNLINYLKQKLDTAFKDKSGSITLEKLGNYEDEATVRALFIYNFTKHIDWPPEKIASTFRIGVWGETKVYDKLRTILIDRRIKNRPVEIIKIDSILQVKECNVLYITYTELSHAYELNAKNLSYGVLIITDGPDVNNNGASIKITNQENIMKFEINDRDLKEKGLSVAKQSTPLIK